MSDRSNNCSGRPEDWQWHHQFLVVKVARLQVPLQTVRMHSVKAGITSLTPECVERLMDSLVCGGVTARQSLASWTDVLSPADMATPDSVLELCYPLSVLVASSSLEHIVLDCRVKCSQFSSIHALSAMLKKREMPSFLETSVPEEAENDTTVSRV